MPPTPQELKKQLDDISAKLDKYAGIIDLTRLPTSFFFQLPVSLKGGASLPLISAAADGDYFVVPHGDGAPTGTPKTAGALYWDYTNHKLWIWTGSAWKGVVLS